jgi:hypothetical protein
MELGKIETAQLEFTFEHWLNIVKTGLPTTYWWAEVKPIEVPHEIAQRYRGFDFPDVFARAIWYDNYSAKFYSRQTPSLVFGEMSMPTIKATLSKMSQEYKEYFDYLMSPNFEDVDCDVLFQLAVVGELRFN